MFGWGTLSGCPEGYPPPSTAPPWVVFLLPVPQPRNYKEWHALLDCASPHLQRSVVEAPREIFYLAASRLVWSSSRSSIH